MIYAGIGSRITPDDVLKLMEKAATGLARMGFTLRSGGARGADTAFATGAEKVTGKLEIYLPFDGFNGFRADGKQVFGPPTKDARLIAKEYHPNWPNLGDRGRDFMARNAYQILGWDLKTPCDFVLCWTPDGKIMGGTGQAMRHATDLGIPILNFATQSESEISDTIIALQEGKKAA